MRVLPMPAPRRCLTIGCACLALALMSSTVRADLIMNVSLNTAPLAAASNSGPYALAFTLMHGDNQNTTTVTLSDFKFGVGGSALDTPWELVGGVSGDLFTAVELTTTTGLNDFAQDFTPGSALSFHLVLTSQAGTGDEKSPDTFTFSILDGTGNAIPTLAPVEAGADSLLSVVAPSPSNPAPPGQTSPVQSFGSKPIQPDDPDKPPQAMDEPVATVVPEPSSIMTALASLILLSGWRHGRRRAA